MRTHVLVATALTFAIGLTGCAANSHRPAPKASGGGASAASPTQRYASVQQYAGVVNSTMKDMRKDWQDYQDDSCDFATSFVCQMLTMSLDIEAKTLVVSLDGAMKPGVPAYIGAPPAEIEKLVADTRAAAQAVDDAIPDDASTGNGELTATARFAVNDLMSTFDRWDPYI